VIAAPRLYLGARWQAWAGLIGSAVLWAVLS
jgi:hypothetical protein